MAHLLRLAIVLALLSAAAPGIAAPPAPPAEGAAAAAPVITPRVLGAEMRVVDLAAAIPFYRDLLGFEVVDDGHLPDLAVLKNGEVELTLRRAERAAEIDYPDEAETHVNLEIEDVGKTLEAVRAAGVTLLGEVPEQSQIGPFLVVRDPAGNLLHLMDIASRTEPLPRPRVFNVGLKVTDMKAARAFYIDKLGFAVFSEDYYPPALPLQRAGAVALVLHESAKKPSAAAYPAGAHTEVVVAVDDLEAAARELAARGVVMLDEAPRPSPTGAYIAIADPDGNVVQLRQAAAPAPAGGAD